MKFELTWMNDPIFLAPNVIQSMIKCGMLRDQEIIWCGNYLLLPYWCYYLQNECKIHYCKIKN